MTNPRDVAVLADETERYKFALSLAARHGHEGTSFPDRIKGDTREAMEQDAAEFASVIADIQSQQEPEPVYVPATDPSQGMGFPTPKRPTQFEQFAETLYNALH